MEIAADAGYEPVLACPADGRLPDEARRRGFRVIPHAFNRLKGTNHPLELLRYGKDVWRENQRVRQLCVREGINLVHAHGPVSALYGISAVRGLGLKMLVHVHDALEPRGQYRVVAHVVSRFAERFICVSGAAREMMLRLRIPPSQTQVVYNALDPSFLTPHAGPPPETCGPGPHFGVFALILPLKGQDVFLDAAALLADRLPAAHFYVVGSIPYPDQQFFLERLLETARTPALAGRVSFPGVRENVAEWMEVMDVVVLPSVEPESFGNVLLEGMSLGRRVIGTNIGGAPELITDGETGRLVPPGDVAALAAAMEDLGSRPPTDPMGRNAAADARLRFSPERFESEISAIYREMLEDNPRAQPAGR
jgi:glycosyltransferase involved in cell wall biosynthesis